MAIIEKILKKEASKIKSVLPDIYVHNMKIKYKHSNSRPVLRLISFFYFKNSRP